MKGFRKSEEGDEEGEQEEEDLLIKSKRGGVLISVLELKVMCSLAIRLWQQQNDTVAEKKKTKLHVPPTVCPSVRLSVR